MQYQIISAENKVSKAGAAYKRATIKDEQGNTHENVAVFGYFKQFSEVEAGNAVEGVLNVKNDPQWGESKSLNNPMEAKGGSRAGMINQAMEKKQEGIAHAQQATAENVKISSTFRDASLITNSLLTVDMTEDDIRKIWERWRAWLWDRYDDPKEREWIENMTMPFSSRVEKPEF